MPAATDAPTVAARAHDLKDAYLTCRTLGHAWRPRTASWNSEARAYYAAYLCERCGGERACWFDQYGRPVSNRYTYPEGYVMPGVGRLDRDDRGTIRLEALARQLGQSVTTLQKVG